MVMERKILFFPLLPPLHAKVPQIFPLRSPESQWGLEHWQFIKHERRALRERHSWTTVLRMQGKLKIHSSVVYASKKRLININRHVPLQGRIRWIMYRGYAQTPGYTAVPTKRLNFLSRQLLQLGLHSALGYTCMVVTKPERYSGFLLVS